MGGICTVKLGMCLLGVHCVPTFDPVLVCFHGVEVNKHVSIMCVFLQMDLVLLHLSHQAVVAELGCQELDLLVAVFHELDHDFP